VSAALLATRGRAAHHARMSILDTLKWLARDLSKVQDVEKGSGSFSSP